MHTEGEMEENTFILKKMQRRRQLYSILSEHIISSLDSSGKPFMVFAVAFKTVNNKN